MSLCAFAQTNTIDYCANPPANAAKGGFTVSTKRGCAPLTVTVTNTTGPANVQYIYDYKGGDPTNGINQTTFIYTKPGRYRILQAGSTAGTGSVACQEVEVLDATPPNFRAYSCANLQVLVDIVNDAVVNQYDEFIVDWGDGTPLQTIPKSELANINHTYASNTIRTIKVSGNYRGINCGGGSYQQITPMLNSEFSKPTVTRLTTSGTNVTFDVRAGNKQVVTVYQRNSAGTYAPTTISRTGAGSMTIGDISQHPACFKVVSVDGCGRKLESEEVCSIGLDVTAQEKQNALRWTAPGNTGAFQSYTINRDGSTLSTITNVSTLTETDRQGITCNQKYCYQVTALVGGVQIVSDQKCVVAQSSEVPPAFTTLQVSVNGDNRVDLRGIPPVATSLSPTYTMLVFRRDSPGGDPKSTGEEVNRNIHQDGNVQPDRQSYCYQVVYQNACGVQSERSAPVCTIYLTSNNSGTIDWTTDSPFAGEGVSTYVVEKLDENGNVVSEINVDKRNTYRPDQNDPDTQRYRFRVKAVSPSGAVSYSNFYTLIGAARLFVPDAFTPNGDGTNDVLEIKGSNFYETIQMTVLNRWGEVVFRTENRETWDGTINGQPAQPGIYAYRIVAQDQTGQKTVRTGSVLLIR